MNRHILTIAVWSMLMSTAIGQTIVDYRGLEVQSPDPTGAAGLRLQNNFKTLADRIGPANLTATAAPTVDDDVDEGYYAGFQKTLDVMSDRHERAQLAAADRFERWETTRHVDSERLEEALKGLAINCAAARHEIKGKAGS